MLSIPLRGDGTLDEDEHAFLGGLASWMQVHGGAIYGTRPFSVFGEGPPDAAAAGTFNEKRQRPYTTEDIRFVTKDDTLYAFAFVWPNDGKLHIKTLARGSAALPRPVLRVELFGAGRIAFEQDGSGLHLALPANPLNPYAYAFTIHT
jgi:alpha-L-fucosidase